ncbi:unnamed protein product [Diamesa tonsa]
MYNNLDGQGMNIPEGFPEGLAEGLAGGFPEGFSMFFMPQEGQGQPGMNCRRGPPRSWGKGQSCNGPWNKSQKTQTPVDFQVKFDVKSFEPEEISVKVKDQQVIIEGKHEEREDGQGFVTRQFTRRYVLPAEIDLNTVSTYVNNSGVMTIKATKPIPAAVESNERSIPIQFLSMSDDEAENETKVPAEEKKKKEETGITLD